MFTLHLCIAIATNNILRK